jgi:5-methylcytosine-specific restriction endonuclease McrA
MNARELSPVSLAALALPSSNPGLTPPLDLPDARKARDDLRALLGAERHAATELLLALADFDVRRGWEALGHASLFDFLRGELRLSRSGAFWRQSTARLLQRFPELIAPLRDGRLCVTTAAELAKVLTRQNLADVLPRYYGLSSREAAEVTAALLPREQPPLRMVVTGLPVVKPEVATPQPIAISAEVATRTQGSVQAPGLDAMADLAPARSTPPAPSPRAEVEPLTAELRRMHMTVDREFLALLDAARDGLSHAIPNATAEQVLRAGLEALLEKQARARGQVKRPRNANRAAETAAEVPMEPVRHRRAGPRAAIPAEVRRAVWARDGGRCCWPIDGGGICGSTLRLELDHLVPWAKGGDDSVDNLRVTCARHNALAARREFGFDYGRPRTPRAT